MSSGVTQGNCTKNALIQQKLTPAQVNANTTSEQTFTVPGVQLNDYVEVNKPSHDVGVTIGNVRASAVNQIAICYINATGAPITPTAETYLIQVTRAAAGSLLNNPVGD